MKIIPFFNKKASLTDPIFTSAYILKISFTIIICLFVWVSFQTLMTETIAGDSISATLVEVMNTLRTAYFSMDYVFPILVGGLMIVSIVFAFKTGTNIVWGILSIIMWAVALLISSVFVNVYIQFADQFPTIYTSLPILDIIMSNLHWVVLCWVAIISLVMFRKNNVEDDMSEIQRSVYGK
jgi:hypothetical protein